MFHKFEEKYKIYALNLSFGGTPCGEDFNGVETADCDPLVRELQVNEIIGGEKTNAPVKSYISLVRCTSNWQKGSRMSRVKGRPLGTS